MILRTGDLFISTAPVLGHGVNCQGVMDAGIAVQFRRRWPEMYEQYVGMCRSDELKPGEVMMWRTPDGRTIANMATQRVAGGPSPARLEWVATSAARALDFAATLSDPRVAIPRIASDLGGLDWKDVESTLRSVERNRMAQFEVWTLPQR